MMNTLQHKIVEFLKPVLEERNITYAQLAHAINITEYKIKDLFSCRTAMKIDEFKDILTVLDIPMTLKIGKTTIKF